MWNWLRNKFCPEAIARPYRAYTTKFDLEIEASEIESFLNWKGRESWDRSDTQYEEAIGACRAQGDVAALNAVSSMRDKIDRSTVMNTDVCLLVDHSGSLHGQRALLSCALLEIVSDYLSNLGFSYEILGFTTRSWRGGKSRRLWSRRLRPSNPGRLCDLLHIVYRSSADTRPGAPRTIRYLLRPQLLKENIDGEAIQWALGRCEKEKKLIIVISDGAPVDDSTLQANGLNYLHDHLREVVEGISADENCHIAAIGIGEDVSIYYPSTMSVFGFDCLGDQLISFVNKHVLEVAEGKNRLLH